MDPSFIGTTPATAENHHHTSICADTMELDEMLDNLLQRDLSEFDFNLFDIPLPLSSQQPVTGGMPIDPVPAPAQPPQFQSFSEVSDNVNLIKTNSALAAYGRNHGGETVLGHPVCLGSGSSAPSSYKKRTVIPPEELAELEISDPKKAQRIIANRVSAQKSKEKKRKYEKELKKRVELLKIKADNVTAERLTAMNEAMQLAAEHKRIKDLIQSTLQHQEKQRAVIKLMKDQANILEMQIHEMNTAMADLSFGEPVSQSQQELYTPPQPPLVPPPQSPFGDPLLPSPPSSFGEALAPPPLSSFGEPFAPPLLSPFGEALVPLSSPFGEPFRDHFIGTNFSNYSPWN
ncbi:transcription factor VIP1 [Lathyrus oleraceus]|uniref:BZIP domain-containing protein n=1 Tax=Pisum sativum TaxID=3888 RepID=A0A9D5A9U8_PEA|nr:transcription factor VIP1-like [Pisum sativum]KAI5400221.1 hypothetical protein KIW84_065226 [Pisum sativum]